jgi:hypothetical protein
VSEPEAADPTVSYGGPVGVHMWARGHAVVSWKYDFSVSHQKGILIITRRQLYRVARVGMAKDIRTLRACRRCPGSFGLNIDLASVMQAISRRRSL